MVRGEILRLPSPRQTRGREQRGADRRSAPPQRRARLEERGRASLPELAEAAGVHPNTRRAHVLELESAGLLVSERRALPSSRGRPGTDYRLSDLWERTSANFLGVAELLAVALDRASLAADQLRAVGSEWGRYLLGRPGSHDVGAELPRVLRELGYQAHVEEDQLELASFPCPTVAPGRPELMCQLAEGVWRACSLPPVAAALRTASIMTRNAAAAARGWLPQSDRARPCARP
jgi:predicted ArsR family transcriptional regulator